MRIDPPFIRIMLISIGLFGMAFLITTGLAHAQSCGPRPAVVKALKDEFGEKPIYMALTDDGRVLEVWATPKGSWTLIMTSPNGHACVYAAGSNGWEALVQGEAV